MLSSRCFRVLILVRPGSRSANHRRVVRGRHVIFWRAGTPSSTARASSCEQLSSKATVRRLANLVLLVTIWSYVAPLALRPSEADLPACCRGHGIHHCAMAGMARSTDRSPTFRINSPQCPYRLLGSVVNRAVVATTVEPFSLETPAADLFTQHDGTHCVSRFQIRNSGRGPPALSL